MRERKEINVEVGCRIRQAREAAGLTQERFAELIGVSPQNVSCVERGERFAELIGVSPQNVSCVERGLAGVSLTVLRRMCQVLRVSSDALLLDGPGGGDADALARRLEQLPPEQFRVVQEIINHVLELTSLADRQKEPESW